MHTQRVYSFMNLELACNILCTCLLKWQDQYHLLKKCYPEGVKPLLAILECIEVALPVDKKHTSAKQAKAQGSERPSKKFEQNLHIPKKPKYTHRDSWHVEKHCKLCKKHGGAHTMHSTAECKHYKKDGTPFLQKFR